MDEKRRRHLTIEELTSPELHRLMVLDASVKALSVQADTVPGAIVRLCDLEAENLQLRAKVAELEARLAALDKPDSPA